MSERYQYLPYSGSCEMHTFDGDRITGEGWYVKEEDHEAEVEQLRAKIREWAVSLLWADGLTKVVEEMREWGGQDD